MRNFKELEEVPHIEKPKRSLLKKLRRIVLVIFLLLIFGVGTLLSLLFIYQDEVKAAIVSELNKHLKAEVKIDPKNIDLTIIKSFPDCSIQFKDLLMLEALPVKNRDTLLFAGQLNLHFNIEDLWNKKYEIEKIKLKDAVARIKVFKNGSNNYTFWETSAKGTKNVNDSIAFNLKLISIENCRITYKDRKHIFKADLELKKLTFKGQFKESSFDLTSEAKILIHEMAQGKVKYLRKKNCEFSVDLDVNNGNYVIKQANMNLNELALALSGNFNYKDSLEKLNLTYKAPKLDISSVLSLLPEKYKNKINDYESSGNFYGEGTVRYGGKKTFSVTSSFGIKNGKITYRPLSTSVTDVNLEGELNYSEETSFLNLKNIALKLNGDEIQGSCMIRNFENPYLHVGTKANVKLENIQNFWPIDTLTTLKGNLVLKAELEGDLKNLKEQTFSDKVKIDLETSVLNLEAQFKGDEKIYSVETCQIVAKEREIEVKDLKLKRGSSDLTINGKMPGIFNYLMDRNSPLTITGSLYSNSIKMEDFLAPQGKSSESNDKPLIPANINFKLNAAILQFSFGKFEARSLTGEMEIKNQKAVISDLKLQTMQGEAELDAYVDNSRDKLEVVLQSRLSNINITELFSQLNNFGQSALKEKNIKGVASSTIEFSGTWSNRLEVDPKSIASVCNLSIERGELIDFKPLLSLSKFVDVQDLKRIKFSSLSSTIEIKNNLITIPKTTIKNSALNVEVWGTHSFSNEIDYHIQLFISELLAKKRKNKDSEFGPVINDKENRRSAFILMTGTLDNPIIKYDRKGLKEKIKTDIKQEKQSIKQLLKEEFGLFRKDSALKKQKQQEQIFELEKTDNIPPKKSLELKKKAEEEDF